MATKLNSKDLVDQIPAVKRTLAKRPKRQPIPDGFSLEDYKGYENWKNRRWAWEFLRRNTEFRNACRSLENIPPAQRRKEKEKIARRFGLNYFKHCDERFGKKGTYTQPAFNEMPSYSKSKDDGPDHIDIPCRKNQVLILFDLAPAIIDSGSLKKQIVKAEVLLTKKLSPLIISNLEEQIMALSSQGEDQISKSIAAELKRLNKQLEKTRGGKLSAKSSPKVIAKNYISYLRLLDLKLAGQLSGAQAYKHIYPKMAKGLTEVELNKAHANIFRKPTELSNYLYLTVGSM